MLIVSTTLSPNAPFIRHNNRTFLSPRKIVKSQRKSKNDLTRNSRTLLYTLPLEISSQIRNCPFESSAHLDLAHHGHLLHGVQHVVKHLIRVLSVDLVGALDAEVEGRRFLRGESDRYPVIVADFACRRVPGVRARVPLAHERRYVVWNSIRYRISSRF